MKLIKISALIIVIPIILTMFFYKTSSHVETKNKTVMIPMFSHEGTMLRELRDDEPPALLEFILASDYVIIASAEEIKPVPKKERKPLNSKDFDMWEWTFGTLYPLKVERVLFSKEAFEKGVDAGGVQISKLEILTKTGVFAESLLEGNRYLLFLKDIPKDDELFKTLELEKGMKFYRTIVGSKSIYPELPNSMHSVSNQGKIDLTTGKYSKLVSNIEAFCEAISTGDKNHRTQKLQRLAESKDESLKANAEFAIHHLMN